MKLSVIGNAVFALGVLSAFPAAAEPSKTSMSQSTLKKCYYSVSMQYGYNKMDKVNDPTIERALVVLKQKMLNEVGPLGINQTIVEEAAKNNGKSLADNKIQTKTSAAACVAMLSR